MANHLEAEHPNLRAARVVAVGRTTRLDCARRGTAGVGIYTVTSREGYQWLQRVLAASANAAPALRARALVAAAHLAYLNSDLGRDYALAEAGVALSQAGGDRRDLAGALITAALVGSTSGRAYQLARVHEAEEALSQIDEPWLHANLLTVKGVLLANQEDWAQAATAYATSLATYRRLGDPAGQYQTLNCWVLMELWQGRYDRAATMAEEALAHITAVGQGSGIAMCLMELGWIAHARGEQVRAAELLMESLAQFRRSGHRIFAAEVLGWQGKVALAQGDLDRARAYATESLALYRDIGDRWGIGWGTYVAALVERRQGAPDRAAALLNESLGMGRDAGSFYLMLFLAELARVTALQGDRLRAARPLRSGGRSSAAAGWCCYRPTAPSWTVIAPWHGRSWARPRSVRRTQRDGQ